jgi:hypothetical protein
MNFWIASKREALIATLARVDVHLNDGEARQLAGQPRKAARAILEMDRRWWSKKGEHERSRSLVRELQRAFVPDQMVRSHWHGGSFAGGFMGYRGPRAGGAAV